MRRTPAVAMTGLSILFLAEGQRALFASMFGLAYDALFPAFLAGPALLAVLPLLALLAPLIPLARWIDRAGAVAIAATGVALFRLPMSVPELGTRLVGGALVLACGTMFLTWAVGFVDRRAMAAGVVLGLVADQLFRLAGGSYDISLQPGWLPVQAVLSLALVAVVVVWLRAERARLEAEVEADREAEVARLERRAGGLRLRGAMALGALLFMDLHVLGLPPVVARWTGVSYGMAALSIGAASALAAFAALSHARPTRGRTVTILLVVMVTAAAILGYAAEGAFVAMAMAAGHLAALLLVTRALDPASGRRGGVMVTAGFVVFTTATALYALTFYPAFTIPTLEGRAPWIFGVVGVLLVGCFVLLPRPERLAPWPFGAAAATGAVVMLSAGLLAITAGGVWGGSGALVGAEDGDTASSVGAERVSSASDSGVGVRVATWNVHYGFDERWRFDPGAMAAALAGTDPQVVALQEALVGAPTSYGIDLPRWLGRRLGMRDHFSPTINGLLGDAFLTSLPGARVDATPLPAGAGDRKQQLRLTADVGTNEVAFHALHLGVGREDRPDQMRVALGRVGTGPAVVLGDLNAEPGSPITAMLEDAGFHDAFSDAGTAGPTFPARRPARRIDWIWIRDLRAASARVLDDVSSDHRAVVATLHSRDGRIGSTDANDLQAP